jgi:hypothetical protein
LQFDVIAATGMREHFIITATEMCWDFEVVFVLLTAISYNPTVYQGSEIGVRHGRFLPCTTYSNPGNSTI